MTKTEAYLYKISFIVFFLGSPNFWIEDLNMSKTFAKTYRAFSKCLNAILPLFIVFELGAFITQRNLSKKQESDLLIYAISHPLLWSYSMMLWNHDKSVKNLLSHILQLIKVYNDEAVEEEILKNSRRDSAALALSCLISVALHTASALSQVVKSEGTFTTVVTSWPLVDDTSRAADVARIVCYIIWWVFVIRIVASYMIVITLTTSITYLYMNLQSYFYSLTGIFEAKVTQHEKERKYREAFILGIDLHTNIIVCFDNFRNICNGIFSGQIIFVISMLVFHMTEMVKSERTFVNTSATVITATSVLIGTGFFLWNAGDITIEASKLPMAMYSSGWQNCKGDTIRIRQLLTIAMARAQKPVVIKGLGIITLSYESYLSLVKSSYSVFSVLY